MARKLKNIKNVSILIFFIVVVVMVDLLRSLFMTPSTYIWSENLIQPEWIFPNWASISAWTILYVLMIIALFLVWRKKDSTNKHFWAYMLFIGQLFLNLIWSFLFFGLRSPFLAMIDSALLWICIAFMIYVFWSISHKAAYLMIPYLIWMTYEVAVSISIWNLNLRS